MSDPGFDPNAGNTGSTGSTGSSSTGGSGSSSSSSGGGSSKPEPKTEAQILAERRAQRAFAELRRSYLEILRRWGLRPTKNLINLAEKGVRGAWSTTQFVAMLRHTPEYRQRFRGIQWKTGMTEGQYLATFAQYKARAQDIGIPLNRRDFSKMLKRGVSFEEFDERVASMSALKAYGPMWETFQQVLEERGIPVSGGTLGKKEMMDFIAGRGSKQWENVWRETFMTVNLEKVAGVNILGTGEVSQGGIELTRGALVDIIRQAEALSGGAADPTKINYSELGQRLRAFNPTYLKRYGLEYDDIVSMELGGPNAAETAAKAERVLATQEAFLEPRAVATPMASQQRAQQEELPQSL